MVDFLADPAERIGQQIGACHRGAPYLWSMSDW
jgi:hypothetical protein